ncbi:MAG: hypothetical protein JRJ84_26100, partial [Deltaproteobacteria bacterium]|nr:hypothetical protein [Deltaproteobacteria bacterium]
DNMSQNFAYARIHSLAAGDNTFTLQGGVSQGTATAGFRRSRIIAVRAASFDQLVSTTTDAQSATAQSFEVSGAELGWDSWLTNSYTPNQTESVVVIGNGFAWQGQDYRSTAARIENTTDATVFSEFTADDAKDIAVDRTTHLVTALEQIGSTKTYALQLSNENSTTTDSQRQYGDIIVWSMTAAGSGVCGDGTLDGGEACDDGGTNGTTTCGCAIDCSYPTAATPCDNATVCDGAETCDGAGSCTAGTPLVLDDGVGCTVDSCDPITGIANVPDDNLCDDSDVCTGTETCDALSDCQAGTPLVVDDGVSCTIDSCDPVSGIANVPNDALCDDSDVCTGVETCDAVLDCQAGTPLDPDDGVACTDDGCDPVTGVANVPNHGSCQDADVCNGAETCDAVLDCQAGTPLDPNDGVSCTVDSCDPITGVANVATDALCDDNDVCTGTETCDAVLDCQAGTPLDPDDGVACTDDSCDSDVCTGTETCDAVLDCQAGTPLDPDDGVSCTVDSCDPVTGVANVPTDSLCDDSDVCSADSCDALLGCANEPIIGCTISFTAYNDCVYDPGLDAAGTDPNGQSVHYTTSNVTVFGIGTVSPDSSAYTSGSAYPNTSGALVDYTTGTSTGVTATFTQNGAVSSVTWQPQVAATWTGGYDTASGTDAHDTFNGIADMTGTSYYGGSGWWIDLTLTGLDPTKRYSFVTTASRAKANTDGAPGYSDRVTIYTLSGADAATNSSSTGTTEVGGDPLKVSFGTGNNHAEGYVARWTEIDPGADGTIVIRTEPDLGTGGAGDEHKAYTFDVFKLEETSTEICGNSILEGSEQCDDGGANGTTTCGCALDCTFPDTLTSCDDGVTCTENDTCDGAGVCGPGTPTDSLCDDSDVCTGTETCDAVLDCTAGTPLDPDDGNVCTADSCDPITGIANLAVSDGTAC